MKASWPYEACTPTLKCSTKRLTGPLHIAGDERMKGRAKAWGGPQLIWPQAWQGARRRLDKGAMVTAILTSTPECSPASDQVLVPSQLQYYSISS